MAQYLDYKGIHFTDWIIFKMLIRIYGEDKLIEILKDLKERGGIEAIKTCTK